MLRVLKLSHRLAVLIVIFSAGFILYGVWSFKTLHEWKVNGPVYQNIVQSKDLIADVLPPPEYILESYLVSFQLLASEDRAEQAQLVARFATLKHDYDERHAFWQGAKLDADIAELLLNKAHLPAQAFYMVALQQFIPAIQAQDKAGAAVAMKKMTLSYAQHLQAIKQLVDMTAQRASAVEAESGARITVASSLLLAILVLSLGMAVAVAVLITKSITRPLQDAVHVARLVASGDLRSHIATDYRDEPGELMRALKSMTESLRHTVGRVRGGTETISTASQEIAAGNLDLSARTEAQAGALEQTSSTMQQLTSTVQQNAESAQQANQLVLSASAVAVQGGQVVDRVVATMVSIKDSSNRIVDIISVIDGIAFQTNILALNAAVEAARAGELGRGFAVVASEVRTLAQRSASAAKEIKQLIAESVEKVALGSKLADEAGGTMQQIVSSVQQVAGIMGEIAVASHEQSDGIKQVNQAISQMDAVTQQNAALVEQAAAAAASMQEQADNMMQDVRVFKLLACPH
ncbi:methyl-accepting chemotaxis protein [Janthinobacterium sp. LM6]|nr:methyl-accepting chemotaxis protein [Janthinobacterium sp. LM6]